MFVRAEYKFTEMGEKWADRFDTCERKSELNYLSVVPWVPGSDGGEVTSRYFGEDMLLLLHAH
jgi:hypothetical protein